MQFNNNWLKIDLAKYIVYIAFFVVFIFFAISLGARGFVTAKNILNITRQTAMISVMAVGMTFVIGSGEIDLSIGSTTALISLIIALLMSYTNSILLSFFVSIVVAILIGICNGILTTKVGIPSFLVTLGMMGIIRGTAMWTTNTAAVPILNGNFNFIFGTGDIFGIPILLLWTSLILIFGHILLKKTPYGKKTLAVGGNETSARYSGVNTAKIKIIAMVISSSLAGLAGILYAGRMQAGRYTFGEGDELSVIAAVILGGTSMAGGNGFIIGAVIGSLMMGMINNGLVIAGLSVSQQMVIRGVIIILAVALGKKTQKH